MAKSKNTNAESDFLKRMRDESQHLTGLDKALFDGLLEEYVGDDYGDTAAEVWYNLFGRSI